MKVIADLHLHSKYSRATSKQLDIANLEKYARIKGLNLLGTGDFTHPLWLKELNACLKEDGSGILKTRSGFSFLLQTEVSLMYSAAGKGRKIHLLLFARDFKTVNRINSWLLSKGRLDYDGRPIFGMNCPDFVEGIKRIDESIEIVPAHVWTPWFGLFGSMSGFDSVEECFEDQSKRIRILETGLSSDPEMNWRLSALDKFSLISNSDSHSFWPWRMGRECNILDIKSVDYDSIINAFAARKGFSRTIEVDPAYGKYHFDGHRNCNISMSPEFAIKAKNICPVCRKPLTIGVLHRVEELSDRKPGFVPENSVPFTRAIPLAEVIASGKHSSVSGKGSLALYYSIVEKFGSEMTVLLETPEDELIKASDENIAGLIMQNRLGKLNVRPGFDGEYGEIILDGEPSAAASKKKREKAQSQRSLSEFQP
jgi:uncharacterized protein (TIGR00375 family)